MVFHLVALVDFKCFHVHLFTFELCWFFFTNLTGILLRSLKKTTETSKGIKDSVFFQVIQMY